MRVVLHSNVLVAAFVARGTCAELLEYCVREHQLLSSEYILEEVRRVCRDAEDDPILGTAVAARCDLLVTGDKDLLELGDYQTIPIVSPRGFWSLEGRGRSGE